MIEKQKFLSILDKYIHKISDTYKEDPNKIKTLILDEISDLPFFKENMALYGLDKSDDGCEYVWALHHQGAAKTVVLFNQYNHAPDFENEASTDEAWIVAKDWMMGLAIHLSQLHKASVVDQGVNLLFMSIPIAEQGQSKIMKHIIRQLAELKIKYDLTYEVVLLSEAQPWQSNNHFAVSTGFAGRMMPIIATKGSASHVDAAYKGLNAISIANEVVKAIELNTEMSDSYDKRMTPPPAFIDFYNVKSNHAFTTPKYTISAFNWHYLKDDLNKKLCQLKELCAWSVEDAINQFNYSYNEYLRKQALPSYRECMHFDFEVVFVDELSSRVQCDENCSVEKMMVKLMDEFRCDQPVVLIGMLESFYPAVSSAPYFEQTLSSLFSDALKNKEIILDITPYHMTTSGINLFKHSDTKYERVVANMPLKENELIDVLKENTFLNLEVLHIGPRTQKESNRFYRIDLEETVPHLIDTLITCIK